MEVNNCKFINFVEIALELCVCLPLYFSKFSKKDFTVHQLLVLLVLKQKLKCSYESLVDDLETRPFVVKLLGLKRIPDSSTVRKFAKRLKAEIIYHLLADCGKQVNHKKLKLVIDATGLHVEDGSFSYRKKLGLSTRR